MADINNKNNTSYEVNVAHLFTLAKHESKKNRDYACYGSNFIQKSHHLSEMHCDYSGPSCCTPKELNGIKIWIILSKKA